MYFRKWMFTTYDQEGFSRLDAPKEGRKITLKFLNADGTHSIILAELEGRTSRGIKPSTFGSFRVI